jgi:hypothetical protein
VRAIRGNIHPSSEGDEMVAPIEMLTPVLTVAQVLDDLPIKLGSFSFGVRGVFEKEGFSSFETRVRHVRYKFGEKPGTYPSTFRTPFHTDDLTGLNCAWFLSPEWPIIVDTQLQSIPRSVSLTPGSQILISVIVQIVRVNVIGFIPRAIQVLELEPPSEFPVPFRRVSNGYVYKPAKARSSGQN